MSRALKAMLLCLSATLWSVEGAQFLKSAAGARSIALGCATGAESGSVESLWYNPASVVGLNGAAITLGHASWIGDGGIEQVFGGFGFEGWGLGFVGQYSGMEDVRRDANGSRLETFKNSEAVGGLALGVATGPLKIGLGGKFLHQQVMQRSALGHVWDAGLIAEWARASVFASFTNYGSAPEIGTGNSPVDGPASLRLGGSLRPLAGWSILGEYRRWVVAQSDSAGAGIEYLLTKGSTGFAIRSGYQLGLGAGDASGLSGGLGFGVGPARLDYAVQYLGAFGLSHRVGLDLMFKIGEPQARQATGDQGRKVRMRQAKVAFNEGRFDEAAAIYLALAADYPAHFGVLSSAGLCDMKRGRFSSALEFFRKAAVLQPENADLRVWMRMAEQQQGQTTH